MITREHGVVNRTQVAAVSTWVKLADPDSSRIGLFIQRILGSSVWVVAAGRTAPTTFTPGAGGLGASFPTDLPLSRQNNRGACESGWFAYCTGSGNTFLITEIFDPEQADGESPIRS